ncbi:hypothetical protein PTSG_01935 [Salpingoeca rosetta]|uniref:RING-type E3 ubiquitin transferase n=1 Tax=Salpingoeca rosetta (strain ATCC 50818 / BSB-021) TaxID=946362 RepID=F2TZD7_SALR5|nr:uncharacterized protein PTSG_01935 [Salpingoeca rosetta]EGD78961.1 hypothetical protein PTSG_01935 [Salpingoeca rosetta]|eukprot:XP_004997917.1 hypothetical protein PTSG_01935 [Salpingoeca rosetta]
MTGSCGKNSMSYAACVGIRATEPVRPQPTGTPPTTPPTTVLTRQTQRVSAATAWHQLLPFLDAVTESWAKHATHTCQGSGDDADSASTTSSSDSDSVASLCFHHHDRHHDAQSPKHQEQQAWEKTNKTLNCNAANNDKVDDDDDDDVDDDVGLEDDNHAPLLGEQRLRQRISEGLLTAALRNDPRFAPETKLPRHTYASSVTSCSTPTEQHTEDVCALTADALLVLQSQLTEVLGDSQWAPAAMSGEGSPSTPLADDANAAQLHEDDEDAEDAEVEETAQHKLWDRWDEVGERWEVHALNRKRGFNVCRSTRRNSHLRRFERTDIRAARCKKHKSAWLEKKKARIATNKLEHPHKGISAQRREYDASLNFGWQRGPATQQNEVNWVDVIPYNGGVVEPVERVQRESRAIYRYQVPAARPTTAITRNTAPAGATPLERLLVDLQYRDARPEDYELLLQLDESVKPKTLTRDALSKFRDVVPSVQVPAPAPTAATVETPTSDNRNGSGPTPTSGSPTNTSTTAKGDNDAPAASAEDDDNNNNSKSTTSSKVRKRGVEPRHAADECPICLEAMGASQVVKQLPCGHVFHCHCIEAWLLNYGITCPLDNISLEDMLESA